MSGARGERYYRIAGQTVAVDDAIPLHTWCRFQISDAERTPMCRIRRGRTATLYGIEGTAAAHPIVHVLHAGQAFLFGDRECARMTVCGGDTPPEGLLLAGISARLSLADTVLLHGAIVDIPTIGGVLFIGASGVGKSTQAELWRERSRGQILNGDRVFLRMDPTAAHAVGYGSPWAGSSPYRTDREAKITLVVELKREREEAVRRLSAEEALTAWLCRAMLPSWSAAMSSMTAAAAQTIARMAAVTPTVVLSVPGGRPTAGYDRLAAYLSGERSEPWMLPTVV